MKHRALILFALYLAAIVYLSLFPFDFQFYPRGNQLVWVPLSTRGFVLDAVLNVFFYMPLGFLGVFAFGRRWWSALLSVACALALSWTIENLQLWTPTRVASWTDLSANGLGAGLGAALAAAVLWSGLPEELASRALSPRWNLSPSQWLMLGCWCLWLGFPFMPATRIHNLREFIEPQPWSWIAFGQLLVGSAALRAMLGPSGWLLAAFAALPAQAFLRDHALSYAALAGAAFGGLAAHTLGPRMARFLVWILPLFLIFEELRPFRLAATPQPFSWEPFRSWYEVATGSYYPVIFGKLFLYTAVVWFLRGDPKHPRWVRAVTVPVVILAAGEWAQQSIEGRTPESTDIVVLLAGAILLALCPARQVPDRT